MSVKIHIPSEELQKLYEVNRRLLHYAAHRYAWAVERDPALGYDDLAQQAFFGLVRAAESYDPSEGKSWASWAMWGIQNELRAALRHAGRGGADSLDVPAYEDGDESKLDLLADESLPPVDASLDEPVYIDLLHKAIEGIPDPLERHTVNYAPCKGKRLQRRRKP